MGKFLVKVFSKPTTYDFFLEGASVLKDIKDLNFLALLKNNVKLNLIRTHDHKSFLFSKSKGTSISNIFTHICTSWSLRILLLMDERVPSIWERLNNSTIGGDPRGACVTLTRTFWFKTSSRILAKVLLLNAFELENLARTT